MNKLLVVTKNEFFRYFLSPLAYVYLICFLLLNGSFAFYFGNFFTRGQADLLPMFNFQPWIYLLFIPGISMRSWAEEFRSKTILQIASLPVSLSSFVWGKFFASWLFCTLALALTFPFWITVNYLGNADNLTIFAGYIGSWLLAGCMLAISQTMSSLTKNQVIALVLSVIANLFFFLSGLEYVLNLFRHIFSPTIVDVIASFSFLTHFDTISQGLIELRDIIFYISIILMFNLTTTLVVSFRTSGTTSFFHSTRNNYYIIIFLCLLVSFCGINMLANSFTRHKKIDFTQEHIFTLSSATQNIISNLKGNITAKLYYSPILGERNPEARLLFDKIHLLLKQYVSLSNGKIELRAYNPLPLSNNEDRALAAGLQALPIIDTNSYAYLGLVLSDDKNHQEVIPFFPLQRKNFVEQDLTEAFYMLGRTKPKLGLITSLPMQESVIENVATPTWQIIDQLSRFYDIISLSNQNNNLDNIDVLMIVHPQNLSQQTINKIHTYSMHGGKILAFFDIATEALQIFSPITSNYKSSDYGDLPSAWGINFINQAAIADLDNSSLIDATSDNQSSPDFTQDLIQFYIPQSGMNASSPITSGLQKIMLTSASVFIPNKNADISFEPLLQAGKNSQLITSQAVTNRISPTIILRNFKADNNPKYIAARIKGKHTPLDVIVVGDTDMLYDSFWSTTQTVIDNSYTIPILDNVNFVLNALDALRGEETMLSLRGKNYISRPFNLVEKERIASAQNFKIKEKDILDNLARAKEGMQEIIAKRSFEERTTFTPDELAVIANIRKQIDQERQSLYAAQNNLSSKVNNIELALKFINIYTIPTILLVILLITFCKKHPSNNKDPLFNTKLIYFIATSLLLLCAGLWAIYHQTNTDTFNQEDTLIFPNLKQQINDITTIRLSNNNEQLTFKKQSDGLWTSPQAPNLLVYQNRIRHLLSNIMDATYYEKKSSGIEYLNNFGLTPVENKDSTATKIVLSDSQGKEIINFQIGKYDIELGRGSRGAFIRLPDNFQVWLAQIDLVDLNLNPNNWTYSTLWNLQFGRFSKINDSQDSSTLANLAKEFLNTSITPSSTTINSSPIASAKINGEDNISLQIDFYKQNNQYFAKYNFENISSSTLLQSFASYAKGKSYAISPTNMEKITNVLKSIGSHQQTPKKTSNNS